MYASLSYRTSSPGLGEATWGSDCGRWKNIIFGKMRILCLQSTVTPPPYIPDGGRGGGKRRQSDPEDTAPAAKRARQQQRRAQLFARLSCEQRKAVYAPLDVPLAIVAAAGSGKTTTLTARIAHMIDTGTSPESILAISFTRKSCEALRVRVDNEALRVRTFHSFALHLLRRYPSCALPGAQRTSHLKVISSKEQRAVVLRTLTGLLRASGEGRKAERTIRDRTQGLELDADFGADAQEAGGGARTPRARQQPAPVQRSRSRGSSGRSSAKGGRGRTRGIFARIGNKKPARRRPTPRGSDRSGSGGGAAASGGGGGGGDDDNEVEVEPRTITHFLRFLQLAKSRGKGAGAYPPPYSDFLTQYERAMRETGSVDFADLVPLAVRMLQRHPKVLGEVRSCIRYILVDEFQDVNAGQLELLRVLGGAWTSSTSTSISAGAGNAITTVRPVLTVCGDDDQGGFICEPPSI